MPALRVLTLSRIWFPTVLLILTLAPTVVNAHATTRTVNSSTSINLLINYGNGTLVWYNDTAVPSSWNYYNVTALVIGGNLGAVFFPSFGSHFVYSINGMGCPASNIFCDVSWGFWTLDGICWDLPSVGVDQVNVSQAVTAAWFLNPVATFGNVPPTGANCLGASIDVKPGSDQAIVNVGARGVIPVAILSTATFDATKVNPMTVRFGKTGTEASPVHWTLQDVTGDGLLDLVLQFKVQNTGILAGDTQATLMGRFADGTPFRGQATIQAINP